MINNDLLVSVQAATYLRFPVKVAMIPSGSARAVGDGHGWTVWLIERVF
jgi:hypothetical protein